MTFQLTATSAYTSNVVYSLASGTLPSGLSLSTSGGISGTPAATVSGTYTFAVAAADAYSNASQSFLISATPRTITWNNASNIGSYVQETVVDIPLVASSSINASVTYSVTAGALPAGLAILSNAISGTLPIVFSNTTYSFTVTASDGLVSNALAMSLTSVINSGSDAYASNVALLAHFDNNSFADTIGHSVALVGDPVITSNGVGLFNSSVYLNGSSYLQYVPTIAGDDFELGSNNFTIEASVYFLSSAVSYGTGIIGNYDGSGNLGYLLYFGSMTSFTFVYTTNGSSQNYTGFNYNFSLNTWYRIAVVRSGNNMYGYVNGTYVSSGTFAGAIYGSSFPLVVGANLYNGGGDPICLNGFIDEVRVTYGSARYTNANYTVSTMPFPTPANFNYYLGNSVSAIGGGPLVVNATTVYGAQPLTYTLASGTLPAGLTVNSITGVTGTTTNPNSTTSYTFAITASDSYSPVTKTFVASVLNGVAPTWITPSGSLGTQVQGNKFSFQLNAIANALTLTTSTSSTTAGNTLTFSSTSGIVLGMTIIGPSIPSNTVVASYSSTTVTTSAVIPAVPSGTSLNFTPTPVTYAVTTGSLPTGLSLNASSGVISGTLGSVVSNTTTNFTVTASTVPLLNSAQSFSITTLANAVVDPYASYVTFEAPFTASAGGSLFYDLAGSIATSVIGTPYISTAASLYGGSSLYLNGSSGVNFTSTSYSAFTFGSNDFTIEYNIYLTSLASNTIIGSGASSTTWSWETGYVGSSLQFNYSVNGTSQTLIDISWSPSTYTWYSLAFVRKSNSFYMFVNGTQLGSTQSISGSFFPVNTVQIGYNNQNNSPAGFTSGYISNIRITNGYGRYTSNYTPSSASYQPVFFLTPAGSLGTQVQNSVFNVYTIAESPNENPLTYSVYSGALPTGLTLDPVTGFVGGSLPNVSSNTISTFTVAASDGTGTALQTFSITTATSAIADPVANSVVAKMHFDGLQGSTSFLDVKGHIIQTGTSTTSVPTINNIIRQMGSGSMFLDGVASFIFIGNAATTYSEFTFGTNDFTVELSVYFTSVPTTACFIEQNAGFGVTFNSNKLYFYGSCPGGSAPSGSNYYSWTPTTDTWYQLAFVRSNGSFTAYVNGSALSLTGSASLTTGSYAGYPLEVGRYNPSSPVYWSGYVDELRVTIGSIGSGAARYTSNYTPQQQPFA